VGKVVVVGSTNTDMTVRVPRIPALGETVLGRDFYITAGGKGANQAVAAARAGGAVFFVTALGTDEFGERALANFVREGINVDFVRRVPGVPSGVALICVDASGENSIAVAPGANEELRPEDVEPPARLIGGGDVILLQLEIPIDTVEATARMAMEQGARVILNPAPAQPVPDSVFELVSTLTPNEVEVEQLTGFGLNDESGLQRAAAALHERGVRDVLITRGARGVFVSTGGVSEVVPAFTVDTVDTTAAGDVFNGALAVAFVEQRSLPDAVRFASGAAAISVTRPGAQAAAPHRAEIESFLRERDARRRKPR
jgi:ribokinase